MPQSKRKRVTGLVTSAKMAKTIVVETHRLIRHRKFGKYISRSTTYKAHDEKREAQAGDLVEIIATRPLSKTKRWALARIVKKSTTVHVDAQAGLTAPTGAPGLPGTPAAVAPAQSAEMGAKAGPPAGASEKAGAKQ